MEKKGKRKGVEGGKSLRTAERFNFLKRRGKLFPVTRGRKRDDLLAKREERRADLSGKGFINSGLV